VGDSNVEPGLAVDKRLEPGDIFKDPDDRFEAWVSSEFHLRKPGKKRVLIASLTLTAVPQAAYGTHCAEFYRVGRDCTDYDFMFVTPRRMAIDNLRNMCVKLAVGGEFDFIYFFDDDTMNDRDVIKRLLPRMDEFNACSAGYFIRGYPFLPMVFKWKAVEIEDGRMVKVPHLFEIDEYEKSIDPDGVMRENVAAVGCGCTMFRVADFKDMPFPWFKTGINHTEDTYWFLHAHAKNPEYKVGMDFNINCGHLLEANYVDRSNVKVMREFHERLREVGGLTQ
jgi:hypothetical protein